MFLKKYILNRLRNCTIHVRMRQRTQTNELLQKVQCEGKTFGIVC